jgi:phosphate-selective porin
MLQTGQILSRDGLGIAGAGVHSAWGPLTFGGEFLSWSIDNAYTGSFPAPNGTLPRGARSVGDLFLSGFYVEALCFLTHGDHRDVNRVIPGYDRVRPVRNFSWHRGGPPSGLGAWEVGVRYDFVNLNSGPFQAGKMDSITVGVNWHLNPNLRVMLNYVYTNLETGSAASSGQFDAFGIRVHLDI